MPNYKNYLIIILVITSVIILIPTIKQIPDKIAYTKFNFILPVILFLLIISMIHNNKNINTELKYIYYVSFVLFIISNILYTNSTYILNSESFETDYNNNKKLNEIYKWINVGFSTSTFILTMIILYYSDAIICSLD